jgi:hypothetical protein
MEEHSIPFIFGVTGHRDLREEDMPKLEEKIRELFEGYQKRYPHTGLIVISALAEGADMLVARVAMELGVTLHVLLPYQEEPYLNSFMDREGSSEEYDRLKAYAAKFEENSCVVTYGTTKCYQFLGERIADTSNMLIALWNRKETEEDNGGTAAIVRYQRDGFGDNMFDARDGNAIYILNTPRISDETLISDPCMAHTEYLGMMDEKSYAKSVAKLDTTNAQMARYRWHAEELAEIEGKPLLYKYKKYFEIQANTHQPIYQTYMTWVLMLTGLGILSLELMHSFSLIDEWKSWAGWIVLGYFGFLASAYLLYKTKMGNGKLQEKFIYSRGLSEAIRIQNAWNAAGLDKRVSKYYLTTQSNKFTWMRLIMKNMHYVDSSHYESVAKWIKGQTDYFRDRVPKRERAMHKWEKIEDFLLYGGIAMMFVVLALFGYETYKHVHLHFPLSWHGAVLVSGILLLGSNFVGRYVKIQGFKEEYNDYKEMEAVFLKAQKHLGLDGHGNALKGMSIDPTTQARIITDLGKKALEENSRWVELHDSRRAKNGVE